MRRIVCAAIRNAEGRVIAGVRHYDAIMRSQFRDRDGQGWRVAEQGFLDQRGTFLTRAEAWSVAFAAGQIRRLIKGSEGNLYSENLY